MSEKVGATYRAVVEGVESVTLSCRRVVLWSLLRNSFAQIPFLSFGSRLGGGMRGECIKIRREHTRNGRVGGFVVEIAHGNEVRTKPQAE